MRGTVGKKNSFIRPLCSRHKGSSLYFPSRVRAPTFPKLHAAPSLHTHMHARTYAYGKLPQNYCNVALHTIVHVRVQETPTQTHVKHKSKMDERNSRGERRASTCRASKLFQIPIIARRGDQVYRVAHANYDYASSYNGETWSLSH